MFAGVAVLSGPERYVTPAVRIPVAVLPEPRAFTGVLVLKERIVVCFVLDLSGLPELWRDTRFARRRDF
jgi:hypothetical protein